MKFNKDSKVMQYCNDTEWRALGQFEKCPVGLTSCGGKKTERLAFVTNETTRGDIGGISGADNMCQSAANAAGLHGTYYAWLADGDANNAPASRFEQSTVPYVLVDGTNIANNWTDLTDGAINSQLNLTELGTAAPGTYVFTNTVTDGTPTSTNHCSNFTNTSGTTYSGRTNTAGSSWSQSASISCNTDRSLYCFEQGYIKSTEVVPDGLVGYWRLDETSGTTTVDSSGPGNDGTVQGDLNPSVNSQPGVLGAALYFDGNGDYIVIGDAYDDSANFTISAWVKADDFPNTLNSIVGKEFGNGNRSWMLRVGDAGIEANRPQWVVQSNIQAKLNSNTLLGAGLWYHIAVSHNTSGDMKMYINGVLDAESLGFTDGTLSDSTFQAEIGRSAARNDRVWEGLIDDVRIYNRALSADEVYQLYAARDGNLRYNADQRVPEYFNGDEWIAAAGGPYVPGAVYFEKVGTTYLDYGSALAGVVDSKMVTGSFWIRRNSNGFGAQQKVFRSSGNAFIIELTATNEVRIKGEDSVGTTQLDATSTATITDTAWHHVMFSADVNAPGTAYFYIDGVDASDAAPTANDVSMYFSVAGQWVGADSAPSQFLEGDLADLWLDFGTYIDLSNADNRRKFITASGDPVDLGAIGQYPTGTAPDIYLSGDATTWATNKGTGGGFTVNGTLTDAATRPSGPPITLLPQGCPSIGDVCDDGTIYAGLSPDGNTPMFTTPCNYGASEANSVCSGGQSGGWGASTNRLFIGATDDVSGATNTNLLAYADASSSGGLQVHGQARRCHFLSSNGADDWYLPSKDESDVFYTNRSLIGGFGTATIWTSTEDSADGAIRKQFWNGGAPATAKSNSFYTRCARKGPAPRCTNPIRLEGAIIYNADFNILQYCDPYSGGNGWRATTE